MNESNTIAALAALAQLQRLRAFRALVVAGPEGLTPTVIAEKLGIAPNSLSFHLKELGHAGLVAAEQRGRNLIYRANFETMNALMGYLTEHCCEGTGCVGDPGAARPVCSPSEVMARDKPIDQPAGGVRQPVLQQAVHDLAKR